MAEHPSCWIVHGGAAGFAVQCRGLAEALGLASDLKVVAPPAPYRWLAPHGPAAPDPRFRAPWPDILIASSRQAVPYARAVKRRSGGKTFAVMLQDPVASRGVFDLLWAPAHDQLQGPNVVSTLTSPHDLTAEDLAREAARLESAFAGLPRPRVAVSVGGANGVFRLGPAEADALAEKLRRLAGAGASLLVTPSRRTDPAVVARLRQALSGTPLFFWDGTGDNPYRAMLGTADAVVVTCDSVNMAGEAAFTGKPVFLEKLPGGSPKFDRFHAALLAAGVVRWFTGALARWDYAPLNATETIAAAVRERYRAHTGRDL